MVNRYGDRCRPLGRFSKHVDRILNQSNRRDSISDRLGNRDPMKFISHERMLTPFTASTREPKSQFHQNPLAGSSAGAFCARKPFIHKESRASDDVTKSEASQHKNYEI